MWSKKYENDACRRKGKTVRCAAERTIKLSVQQKGKDSDARRRKDKTVSRAAERTRQ